MPLKSTKQPLNVMFFMNFHGGAFLVFSVFQCNWKVDSKDAFSTLRLKRSSGGKRGPEVNGKTLA